MNEVNQTNPINRADNLQNLLTPRNETTHSLDIYIYGDIVSDWWGALCYEDQYPSAIKDLISAADGRTINVHINSRGGSVFGGMAIYNILANYEGEVVSYIDGQACSIASVIALAGDRIVMRTGSAMMVHKPLYKVSGAYNANSFRKLAENLDEIQNALMQVYIKNKKTETSAEDIEAAVNNETWMTAEKASAFFDRIEIEANQAIAIASSEFVNHYARSIPPQFAQGNSADEEIKNAENAKRAREIEILNMEERK